ncbi:MAG TPA: lipopolysaccharide assembly protein LapB, partial [Burkholderiaceae bacterium]|nr:lipopolysaccharide assembly protein LapB [Burkholderiaceae bacterium]
MEFELWYLVALPLVFAAGWFGRGFESRARASDNAALPRSYFRGLNLLLNDQHDKAIDAFIEVVKLDPETIELHHALGNLFRRRGEFDRAVRIHTHLLNRADLPARERSQALAELGQDYLKGGLLDRAEDAFTRLLEDRDHRFDALRALLRIFQMEREWMKA